jgi:hypothetical protein
MPRNARRRWLVLVAVGGAGCLFDASYRSGQTTCGDGRCPSGLVCSAQYVCVAPGQDAGGPADTRGSDAPDAHVPALTCSDPGELASGVAVTGTTMGRTNMVTASCAGSIMTGFDAEYAIALGSGHALDVTLAGSAALAAYVLPACSGGTPPCIDNAYATTVTPLATSVQPAGTYFVIVDSTLADGSGAYTLTVTVD